MNRKSPQGFTLLEVMLSLILMTMFAAVGTRLFTESMRIWKQSSDRQDDLARFDQAIAMFRADVWKATSLESNSSSQLICRSSADHQVKWSVADDGSLLRTESNGSETPAERSWTGMGRGVTLTVKGNTAEFVPSVDSVPIRLRAETLMLMEDGR